MIVVFKDNLTKERNRIFKNSLSVADITTQRALVPIDDEIEKYFSLALMFSINNNILEFWKENQSTLPLLCQLARIVLGLPATSAAAESKFSVAGTLIAANRSKLNPEKAKRLLYVHDNYDNIEAFLDG